MENETPSESIGNNERYIFRAIARLIERNLRGYGFDIPESQFIELESRVKAFVSGKADELDLPDSINLLLDSIAKEKLVEIDLNQTTDSQIEEVYESAIQEIFHEEVNEESARLYKGYEREMNSRLKARRKQNKMFSKEQSKKWGRTLDLLENFFLVCYELGDKFNEETMSIRHSGDSRLEALIRLQARACQVSFEVLTLLREGFADGAHARWRTLHEISVISSFLNAHEPDIAERYLEYDWIRVHFDAKAHRENYKGVGEAPLSDDEFLVLRDKKAELEKRFGKSFSNENGWASSVLSDTKFVTIEKSVNMNHLRPYYRLANMNIHAGSSGLYFRLGQSPESPDVLVAGPSVFGVLDPTQGASISMAQITTSTLSIEPNFERLSQLTALKMLLDDLLNHSQELISSGET